MATTNGPQFPNVLPPNAPCSAPGGVPGQNGVITPSDTVKFAATRRLYIGVTGAVSVTMSGQTVTFPALTGGLFYDLAVTQVLNTGTTATGIIALN